MAEINNDYFAGHQTDSHTIAVKKKKMFRQIYQLGVLGKYPNYEKTYLYYLNQA